MNYIIVAGDRDFTNYDYLEQCLNSLFNTERPRTIISGCARGVDTLAIQYAQKHNLPLMKFPADWDTHGKSAGPIRNREMARNATHLVAFLTPHSKGTRNMVKQAREFGLTVKIYHI